MVLFAHIIKITKFTGMLPSYYPHNFWYFLLISVNLFWVFSMVLHSGYFFYTNYKNNPEQAVAALIMGVPVFMHMLKIFIGLQKNKKLLALYLRLKRLHDDPKEYRDEIREPMDKRIEFYTEKLIKMLLLACYAIILTPILVMALEYIETGDIKHSRYDLPIPYASPFYDTRSSPAHEILYVTFFFHFPQDAFMMYSLLLLFVGIAMHIHGLFLELKCRLQEANVGTSNGLLFRDSFKNCIDFQNEIYQIVQDTEDVFSNVFFTQFVNTITTVCLNAHLATQVSFCGSVINFNLSAPRFLPPHRTLRMAALCLISLTLFAALENWLYLGSVVRS